MHNCQSHPECEVQFIQTNLQEKQESDDTFICSLCFNYRNLSVEQAIPISLFRSVENDFIFSSYPYQDRTFPNTIKNTINVDVGSLKQEIQSLFKDLRSQFLESLDYIQQAFEQKTDSISNTINTITEQYNEMTQKNELQEIISNINLSPDQKSEEIKKIFSFVKESTLPFTKKLEEQLLKFDYLKDQVKSCLIISRNMQEDLIDKCENIKQSLKRDFSSFNDFGLEQKKLIPYLKDIMDYFAEDLKQKPLKSLDDQSLSDRIYKQMHLVSSIDLQSSIASIHKENNIRSEQLKLLERVLPFVIPNEQIQGLFGWIQNPLLFRFTLTDYKDSQQILVKKEDKGVTLSLKGNLSGQAVSTILENDKSYLVKVNFSKPIGSLTKSGITIGLILNNQIHSNWVLSPTISSGYTTFANNYVEYTNQRQQISSKMIRDTLRNLEFRFCISKQQFLFADSTYTNINQAKQSLFDPKQSYRFGVYFQNCSDDLQVCITEFREILPSLVVNFK